MLVPGRELAAAALSLYAKVLAATSLEAAAHRLVAALCTDFGFSRASLGLREHGVTRLLASSGLDLANPLAELPQRLLGAMDEALDQGLALAWPNPTPVAADPITLEQQALQRLLGGALATVPLGVDGDAFAVLCVERDAGPALGADELAALEQLMLLAAPALRWMLLGGQPWHRRVRRDLQQGLATLRQPRRRGTRRVLVALALALLFIAVAPLEDAVSGRARVEGAQQRVLSAPTDGFVKAVHVRPGDRVKAGDPLLDLAEGDLQLERGRSASLLEQYENAYAAAMAKFDRVGASTSMARIGEAQAQLALVDEQLARGRLRAPFDGLVIQGDLSQSVGAPVRQGDALLTLASAGAYRVIVEIDEADIARVRQGQPGQLALSSLPWQHQDLHVERISPLSKAVDGRNVFEVEARLAAQPSEMRPGLIGRAELVTGRTPPLWAWTRHVLDRLRLTWWAWLG